MIRGRVDISQSGKLWIGLAGLVVSLYVLWQLSSSISAGSYRGVLLVAGTFVAFFAGGTIARDWRSGVYYFLVWLLFEDLIRKYMGNNMYIYFAKDVLLAVTYGSFLVSRIREGNKPFHAPFRFALVAFVLWGFVQVFNPLSPSIFYGLLGLKLYFFYIPLMFVGYSLFRKESDLTRFFVVNMALAAVIAVVGILQSIVGLGFLNPRNAGEEIDQLSHLVRSTHSGLEVVRPPSVFVSDGRFGSYMLIAFIVGLGGTAYLLLRSRRGRPVVFAAVGLIFLASMISGSRGVFMYVIASAVLLSVGTIWGAPIGNAGTYRLVKAIRRTFVMVAVTMCLAVTFFPATVRAPLTYYRETVFPDSEYSETGYRTWAYPLANLRVALEDPNWVMGHGIGTASLGAQYVTRIMGVPRADIGVEEGFGVLLLELGILGPLLWLLWTVTLIVAALRTTLRLKGTWAFPVALSILWYAFILLFPITWAGLAQYQNFVANAYFWLLVGILFRLPDLVKQNPDELQVSSATVS